MRRKFVSLMLLIAFTVLISLPNNLSAQEDFDFNRAYQDYTFRTDEYRKAEAAYQLKRSEYLRHGTLSSKNEAIDATRGFLKARDQVAISYLTAVRKKLEETPGMSGSEKDPYFAKVDAEVGWYQGHVDRLDTAVTLDDLVDDSEEAADQYQITELSSFDALTAVSNGKLSHLRGPLGDLISQISSKVSEIRATGDKDTSIVEKWVLDAENENVRSEEKISAAKVLVADIKENQKSSAKRTKFNASQSKMSEAHQHVKEANRYLGEIIQEIKTED